VLGYDVRGDGLLALAVAARPAADGDLLVLGRQGEGVAGQSLVAGSGGGGLDVLPERGPGPFAVRVQPGQPKLVLELWRGAELAEAVSLRGMAYPFANLGFGEVVRFSPRGDELALGSYGVGAPLLLLDVARLEPVLRPTIQRGFAWSPDGAWFALASAAEVRIAGALRSEATFVLPLEAATLAWR
jgi:hypothetical protein